MSRSRVVLAGAVGIVALAGGAVWALGKSGTESSTDTSATPLEPVFPCVTAITSEPRPSRHGRVVLDAALLPPKRLRGRPAREPGSRFPYWMKQGIQIAAQAPPVEIALPLAWRSRAGIHWGDRRVTGVVRFPSCPGEGWLVFVGGFHLTRPSACLPLDVRVGARRARIHVGIGRRCPAVRS